MPAKRKLDMGLHYSRWKRIKEGASVDKVAEDEGVRREAIQISFRMIEHQKSLYSFSTLETVQIESIMSLQKQERAAWETAFKAKIKEVHETPLGTVTVENPDHDTVLATSNVITSRISALRERKGMHVNVNAQANASSSSQGAGGISFESKLREILQRRKDQKTDVIEVPALPSGDDADVDDEG